MSCPMAGQSGDAMDAEDRYQRRVGSISLHGFKSIRALDTFALRPLNILIGANGSGKSNFIGFFRLLAALARQDLKRTIATSGGADRVLFLGRDTTGMISAWMSFGDYMYAVHLQPTQDDGLVVGGDAFLERRNDIWSEHQGTVTMAERESRLKPRYESAEARSFKDPYDKQLRVVYRSLRSWIVYHFHDTSDGAAVKRRCDLVDGEVLREEGDNLAAFLHALKHRSPAHYLRIVDTVRLVAPFFDSFHVDPLPDNPQQTQLRWLQRGSDRIFDAGQLSDGTLRFICLAAALLQPEPPATILLDEPELGLHPYALQLLGGMLASTSQQAQIIVSTQSAALLNDVEPEDVIVVERGDDEGSTFHRLRREDLAEWLEEYTLGELWQKNVFGGRPR